MPFARLLLAWIMMFAIPVQGFAAASMLYCGQGAGHAHQASTADHAHGSHGHGHGEHDLAAGPGAAADSADGAAASAADLMHKCGVCASCCNAVAISHNSPTLVPEKIGRADAGEPIVAAYSRSTLLPDKPPRA
jgi:hypothetical protein